MRSVYAVRDIVADDYVGGENALMLLRTQAAAERAFVDGVANPQSFLHRRPQDYELWWIAFIDDDGQVVGAPVVQCILTGRKVLERGQQERPSGPPAGEGAPAQTPAEE